MGLGWKPTLEVPPGEDPVIRRRKTRPTEQTPPTQPPPPKEEITRDMVQSAVIVSMGFLGTFVDESFMPVDKQAKPLPHVDSAINDMMPWMRIHGGILIRMMPWFGLGSAVIALAAPAFDPICEIIAGVRKPRCIRKGPDDIYTEEFKAAKARWETKQQAAKEPERQAGRSTRAADQVIDIKAQQQRPAEPPPAGSADEYLSDEEGKVADTG